MYLLYLCSVCMITSGCNQEVAVEVDTITEQFGLATWDQCSPEMLPHKTVGVLE